MPPDPCSPSLALSSSSSSPPPLPSQRSPLTSPPPPPLATSPAPAPAPATASAASSGSSSTSPPAAVNHPTSEQIDAVIQAATSQRQDPDGRIVPLKDTRTQLFVGNLPYRVRWQDLKDLFRKAGTVLRADVALGPDNRSRGYGTVLLATAEDAGRAVDIFNGYSWQTRVLEVRLDRLPADLAAPDSASASFAHAVPFAAAMHASAIGHHPAHPFALPLAPPQLPAVPRPFSSGAGASAGVSVLDDPFAFNPLSAHDRLVSRTLFVGNLPFHVQWQDLKDLFRQAGTILRADVALGADGRSRGFGTVVYATEADAERALRVFNGYDFSGRTLKVHYDKFAPTLAAAAASASPVPNPALAALASNLLASATASSSAPSSSSANRSLSLSPLAPSSTSASASASGRLAVPSSTQQHQQKDLEYEYEYDFAYSLDRDAATATAARDAFEAAVDDTTSIFRPASASHAPSAFRPTTSPSFRPTSSSASASGVGFRPTSSGSVFAGAFRPGAGASAGMGTGVGVDAFRPATGVSAGTSADAFRFMTAGADVFRSGADAFRPTTAEAFRSSAAHATAADAFRPTTADAFRSSAGDAFRSSGSDAFRSSTAGGDAFRSVAGADPRRAAADMFRASTAGDAFRSIAVGADSLRPAALGHAHSYTPHQHQHQHHQQMRSAVAPALHARSTGAILRVGGDGGVGGILGVGGIGAGGVGAGVGSTGAGSSGSASRSELPTPPSSSGTGASPVMHQAFAVPTARRSVPFVGGSMPLTGSGANSSSIVGTPVVGGSGSASLASGSGHASRDGSSRASPQSATAAGAREAKRAMPAAVDEARRAASDPNRASRSNPTSTVAAKRSPPATRTQHQQHPAHPGPIALPPPSSFAVPTSPASPYYPPSAYVLPSPLHAPPAHYAMMHAHAHAQYSPLHHPAASYSPLHHPASYSPLHHPAAASYSPLHHPAYALGMGMLVTPHGLPPITPSMPSFQFHHPPQQQQQQSQYVPPPHHHHQPHAGPAAMFSPGVAMSPGAFWGRPERGAWDAAVGAPVRARAASGAGAGNSTGAGGEDYFAGSARQKEPEDYFEGVGIAGEILRRGDGDEGRQGRQEGAGGDESRERERDVEGVSGLLERMAVGGADAERPKERRASFAQVVAGT